VKAVCVRLELKHSHRPPAHPVASPAEDHGVDPSGQHSLQQHLALTLMKKPADKELHLEP